MQPNHRYQQDTEQGWWAGEATGRFPTQPRYREARRGGGSEALLAWGELNVSQPAEWVAPRGGL